MSKRDREAIYAEYKARFDALPRHKMAAELVGILQALAGKEPTRATMYTEATNMAELGFDQQVGRIVEVARQTGINGLGAQIADKFAEYDAKVEATAYRAVAAIRGVA